MSPTSQPVGSGMVQQLAGAKDIALGDETALQRMDLSADAFWHSFLGLVLSAIIDATLLFLKGLPQREQGVASDWPLLPGIIVLLAIALLAYLASLVLLYVLLRDDQQRSRFPVAIIVTNWLAPLASLLAIPLVLFTATSADPDQGAILLNLALFLGTIGLLVMIGIRAIRISLQVPQGLAIAFFAASTAGSVILQQWFQGLLGF